MVRLASSVLAIVVAFAGAQHRGKDDEEVVSAVVMHQVAADAPARINGGSNRIVLMHDRSLLSIRSDALPILPFRIEGRNLGLLEGASTGVDSRGVTWALVSQSGQVAVSKEMSSGNFRSMFVVPERLARDLLSYGIEAFFPYDDSNCLIIGAAKKVSDIAAEQYHFALARDRWTKRRAWGPIMYDSHLVGSQLIWRDQDRIMRASLLDVIRGVKTNVSQLRFTSESLVLGDVDWQLVASSARNRVAVAKRIESTDHRADLWHLASIDVDTGALTFIGRYTLPELGGVPALQMLTLGSDRVLYFSLNGHLTLLPQG
jgi:hypothetical protein